MAQPTQVLPSWLTLSTTIITFPDGTLSTSSDILRLPLTYYGPSIPLGTDGVWTYGGLTPPPSTSAIPTSSLSSSLTSSPSTMTSAPATASTTTSSSSTPSSTESSSSISSVPTAVAGPSHGISPATLGAILGSILGTLLLLILIAIFFLLRGNRHRQLPLDEPQPSSSFWNRPTTLMSLRNSQVPIWTGWEIITPEDANPNGPPSPGEGSPRGSGEEDDPFLTRRSIRSDTEGGHARTDTDTLVSLPAIARTGTVSSHRSMLKPGEQIIHRDAQMRLDEEMGDALPYPSIRVVERRPSTDFETPLLPPPPLNSLGLAVRRPDSHPSFASEKSKATDNARSITSEKSDATDVQEPEGAELLTARRVKVRQVQPLANPDPSTSTASPSVLGLDRLANLTRFSWFKRMSFLGAPSVLAVGDQDTAASDSYTRTPPRHSRNGSRSRPGSFARVSTHEPTTDSFGRRLRHDSGLGFGLAGERPISSVSGQSATSGNTVFYDAHSRPGSSTGTRSTGGSGSSPVPPVPLLPQAHISQPSPLSHEVRQSSVTPESSYDNLARPENPPTYETATAPQPRKALEYSDIDVLDMPVPRPASPFSAASGSRGVPPGLGDLPNPTVWRNSHASSSPSPAIDDTSGISIDVLEEAPPAADGGWLTLAGGVRSMDGRRTTFGVGVPMVVQPHDALRSERGSLHSVRSHLSPHSSRSRSGSAAASSRRTMSGSGSSRPSGSSHSRGPTGGSGGSLVHSNSISFDDHRPGRRRGEVGEIASPPLSAVHPTFPRGPGSPPPSTHTHGDDAVLPVAPAYPGSAPVPLPARPGPVALSGTMTSMATRDTTDESLTDLSVTTAQTDPIIGAIVHFPRLPWRSGSERPVREDAMW